MTDPLVAMAHKTIRHNAEEELRALPTAERVERVLRILAIRGGQASESAHATLVFHVYPRPVRAESGSMALRFTYSVTDTIEPETNGSSYESADAALVAFGTDTTLALEKQLEELRVHADNIERRLSAIRAPLTYVATAKADGGSNSIQRDVDADGNHRAGPFFTTGDGT